jgi:pro-sigmaK processing inhibitor BofA
MKKILSYISKVIYSTFLLVGFNYIFINFNYILPINFFTILFVYLFGQVGMILLIIFKYFVL